MGTGCARAAGFGYGVGGLIAGGAELLPTAGFVRRRGRPHRAARLATSMYVFLARVATQRLVILTVTLLGLGFPYSPTQVGLTLLTVGIPTLSLTMWAPGRSPRREHAGVGDAVMGLAHVADRAQARTRESAERAPVRAHALVGGLRRNDHP